MKNDVVLLEEVGDGIVQITMQDKVHRNTFSDDLNAGLINAFENIKANETAKAVILTGYSNFFCSGGTQETLLSIFEGKQRFTDENLYSLALDCKVPVISAMQGHGIGGGFVMGLFADFVILSRESVYTTNFMKYGFTPGMGATYILPKKLGLSLSEEMMLSARNYRGGELKSRGIPFPVLNRNEVLPYAHDLAKDLAEKPRNALITLKAHLVSDLRAELQSCIDKELLMHEETFHEPEVKGRIEKLFGKNKI